MNDVMISIYVATYNHEKYITQALDSILMQKTQYSYEVYVGEDCSKDNTRQVLKQWEREHPGVFHILYREQNMNKQPISNTMDLKLRCKGKYIIALEGDDFWTDPEKLEKQVTFLEEHPDYYAVAHNCVVVDHNSKPSGEQYPECKDAEYSFRHFASEIMPGQLTTVLFRNYMTDENLDKTLVQSKAPAGDRNLFFTALCNGKVHCIQEVMSAYRHITSGGSSYSATYVHKFSAEEMMLRERVEYAKSRKDAEAIRCANVSYLLYLRHAFMKGLASKEQMKEALRVVPNPWRYLPILLKRDINRFVFHKVPNI